MVNTFYKNEKKAEIKRKKRGREREN